MQINSSDKVVWEGIHKAVTFELWQTVNESAIEERDSTAGGDKYEGSKVEELSMVQKKKRGHWDQSTSRKGEEFEMGLERKI